MIKSKSSRTNPKGRQHAILSTVVELNHGRKKKKQMSFGEGRERWDRKKKCLLQRQVAWHWVQSGTEVCQICKGFLGEGFFALALKPNLLEGNTINCVNMGKNIILFPPSWSITYICTALRLNQCHISWEFSDGFCITSQKSQLQNLSLRILWKPKSQLLYWLGRTVLH